MDIDKWVYFVRHGESEANVTRTVQGDGLPDLLTEKGQQQAKALAERFSHLSFDALISSDMQRAHDTAKAISERTGKEIEINPLFREVSWPSSFVGNSFEDEHIIAYRKKQQENAMVPDWQHEDEETFHTLVDRAHRAIEFLEAREEKRLVVVSHGMFLKFLVSVLLMDKTLTPEAWSYLRVSLRANNTGITAAVHKDERWYLATWNDYAHFAE